ncbi:MAG: hypothetical protein KGL43_09120, partial [Burkholderiales bacterium]|nr:hypothetical protein [Burkholderiales bacterium]
MTRPEIPSAQASASELLDLAIEQMFSGETSADSPMTRYALQAVRRAREAGAVDIEVRALPFALHHRLLSLPFAEAEDELAAAEQRCRDLGVPNGHWRLQVLRANLLYLHGDYAEAIAVLDRVEQRQAAELSPLLLVTLLHVRSYACKWSGRLDPMLEDAHRAVHCADASAHARARAATRINLAGILLSMVLDPEAALPLLEQARELLLPIPSPGPWMECLGKTVEALDMLGRHDEAYACFLRDVARPGAVAHSRATASTTVLALIGVGRHDEAQAWLGEAPSPLEGDYDWMRYAAYRVARLRLLCARSEWAAARAFVEADADRILPFAGEPLYEVRMQDGLRQACAELGDLDAAMAAAAAARAACLPVVRLSARARYFVEQLRAGGEGAKALSPTDLRRLAALEQAIADQPVGAPAEAAPGRVPPFVAHVVHELRTPIGGVMGMASLLMLSGLDAKQRHYAETMQRSAQTLLLLVNDILDLARLERGQFEFDLRAVEFEPWLHQALAPFVELAAAKGLGFTTALDPGLPRRLVFDELRLRQVLSNLVSNALKFTRQGRIDIEVRRRPVAAADGVPDGRTDLRFEVRDSGCGIAAAAIARLFQEFAQADASVAREYGGSGLGLALSKRLVECMGGRIGVLSRLGVGSRFWF